MESVVFMGADMLRSCDMTSLKLMRVYCKVDYVSTEICVILHPATSCQYKFHSILFYATSARSNIYKYAFEKYTANCKHKRWTYAH